MSQSRCRTRHSRLSLPATIVLLVLMIQLHGALSQTEDYEGGENTPAPPTAPGYMEPAATPEHGVWTPEPEDTPAPTDEPEQSDEPEEAPQQTDEPDDAPQQTDEPVDSSTPTIESASGENSTNGQLNADPAVIRK